MFQFENHNGRLSNYVTGHRKVAAQIVSRNSIYKHLQIEGDKKVMKIIGLKLLLVKYVCCSFHDEPF